MSRSMGGTRPTAGVLATGLLVLAAIPGSLAAAATAEPSSIPTAVPSVAPSLPSVAPSLPPATPYRVGERWEGRLKRGDTLRLAFTLDASQHLRLRMRQPRGADTQVVLSGAGGELLRQRATAPGGRLDIELWLGAGDFEMALLAMMPGTAARGRYALRLGRLDPFRVPADVEPNDAPSLAREAPASLRWEGEPAGAEPDVDAWWLPALTAPGDISVRVDGEPRALRLFTDAARAQRIDLVGDGEGAWRAADPPVGVRLYLELHAEGPYRIELEAPGWEAAAAPVLSPPVELALELPAGAGPACLPTASVFEATLELVNAGALDLDLQLRTVTSHAGVSIVPGTDGVRLAPGDEVRVPLSVSVGAGACPDEPVTLSIAALAPDGGLLSVSRTVPPVAHDDAAPSATPSVTSPAPQEG